MERITVWMARVGFLSIAACTFGLSFDAISDVARQTGAVDPSLAWIVPLAVDGMIVTATAVLWTESLSGRGWHIFPLLAIVGPAALSMWANIAHASGQSLLAQVLAAVPPAGLILSLELVAWQIRRERKGGRHERRLPRGGRATAAEAARGDARNGAGRGEDARGRSEQGEGAGAELVPAQHQPTPHQPAPQHSTAPHRAEQRPVAGPVHVGRDDDTGRITLDIPQDNRNSETWHRIIAAVQESGAMLSQRELADELNVPRSRVQRAIDRNRDEWDVLRRSVESRASNGNGNGAGERETAGVGSRGNEH